MPSPLHETLVELVRTNTSVVRELLQLGGLKLAGAELRPVGEGFSEAVSDYRGDAATLIVVDGEAIGVAVIEVQLDFDPDKTWSLPMYQTAARARHRVPAVVVVVAPRRGTANRYRRAIELGNRSIFRALVIGPKELRFPGGPPSPELAFLEALAHGRRHPELVEEATFAFATLPPATVTLYCELLLRSLPDALRRELEAKMSVKIEYQSEFVKNHLIKPFEQARAQGVVDGEAIGLRTSLETFLLARGLELTSNDRTRIAEETDLTRLKRWIERAATCSSVASLFADP